MAFKLPNLSAMSSKTRVLLLFVSVALVGVIIYIGMQFFGGGQTAMGPSRVAGAPAGLQSVPGSKDLSPEYYRTLMQANAEAAQQAKISGGSAVPTLISQQTADNSTGGCTVLCPNADNANAADEINEMMRSGKMSQKDGNRLLVAAKRNVSMSEYAATLDNLVKAGKLSPEAARKLLQTYTQQNQNQLMTASASMMDSLIKSGTLSLGAANELLASQKSGVTPESYAAELQRLVKEKKLSPNVAAQLLGQYTQQYAHELAKEGVFSIAKMAAAGELIPDVAKILQNMQLRNVPVDDYKTMLDKLVASGKLTPAAAAKLLAEYKAQRMKAGVTAGLEELMTKGGLSADLAKQLLALQMNNALLGEYQRALQEAVRSGLITPEKAAELLKSYTSVKAAMSAPQRAEVVASSPAFAKLQENLANGSSAATSHDDILQQFQTVSAQTQSLSAAEKAQRIQEMQAAMATQAQTLTTGWQPPTMTNKAGSAATPDKTMTDQEREALAKGTVKKRDLIKAGTIFYAVLETAVNSDYPDTPVMATIVQGAFKGAKVLGKLRLASGQDKVSLNFTQMDMDAWGSTKTISAFGVDPDTSRTVLASSVDYHYLKRYGSIIATSFLAGYANSITQAGTSTTGIFGTSTSHAALSPTQKIAVGLGQVGTAMSTAVSPYFNTPNTVKINSGVGLGILFVASVQESVSQ